MTTSGIRTLRLYAGPLARQHIQSDGLSPHHVRAVLGAAGGPKGLILNALDRYLFGDWLRRSDTPVDLVGASIGAWRMAAAAMTDADRAFANKELNWKAERPLEEMMRSAWEWEKALANEK